MVGFLIAEEAKKKLKLFSAEQLIGAYVEKIREGDKLIYVRLRIARLPMRNSLYGNVQHIRKLVLPYILLNSELSQIFAECHGFILSQIRGFA